MRAEYIFLGGVLLAALCLFWTQKLRTDVTALLVTLALILPWPHPPGGDWHSILTYQEGFAGFGSVAVIMVVAMFVLSAALVRTGAAEAVAGQFFRTCAGKEWTLQLAVLAVATLTSMFINDTTVVLILMPMIVALCQERNLSPSRYLLPLAYGSLLGGQWTLIGTRSNIVISDYLRQHTGKGIGFFDFSPVAAAVFVAAVAAFFWWGRRRLPKHGEAAMPEVELTREYLTEVMITPQSGTVGKTIDELEWAQRQDLSVLGVIRGDQRMPADGWLRLQPGDVLIMQGPIPTIGQLLKSPDFRLKEEIKIGNKTLRSVDLVTVEALVAPDSSYLGQSLEAVDFTRDYGFTVLGISRHGRTIHERPMATTLEFGDSLLLLGHVSGVRRLSHNTNLLLLGQQTFHGFAHFKALITVLLLLGVIGGALTGMLNPAVSIPLAAMLTILLRCIKIEDAYRAVDWQAAVTVAGMIPFGFALEKTGAAEGIASLLVQSLQGLGPLTMLGALLLLAIVMTQLIENAAVAIIMAPLVFEVAHETGVDPKPFLVGLGICVSAGFCTPFAHESTIFVMGPGRYQFKHYLQVGGLFAFLTWLLATLLTPLVWPF
jgi:di/tricarboxylate transporter